MKHFIFCYVCANLLCCCYPVTSYSQHVNPVIAVSFNNIPLTDAFIQLNARYRLNIAFNATLLAPYTTGTIQNRKTTLQALLQQWCKQNNLKLTITDDYIMVTLLYPESNPGPRQYQFSGRIYNTEKEPLYGAIVKMINGSSTSITTEEGFYEITTTQPHITVAISYVGYASAIVNPDTAHNIILTPAAAPLPAVAIQSGIQKLPAELVTGSYNLLTADALERNNFPGNFLDKISGVTNALSLTKNIPLGSIANEGAYSLRGRNTINSNPLPLVVVDNFPFQGNLNDINPNDIATITLLKDATATSIWGAFSGNGVITVTTKNATGRKDALRVISNTTLITKPNAWYSPALSSKSYIELEQLLFQNKFYDVSPTAITYLSPAVEVLNQHQNNLISTGNMNRQLDSMAHIDIRNDINRYYYQTGINQQLYFNAQGGDDDFRHYYSIGLEKQRDNLTQNKSTQLTMTLKHTHLFLHKHLELATNAYYTSTHLTTTNDGGPIIRPYTQLAGAHGTHLAIPYYYRQSFTDTAGRGLLLDWTNKPLDDLALNNIQTNNHHIRLNIALTYTLQDVQFSFLHQYTQTQSTYTNLRNKQSSYVRNMVNKYSQVDYNTNTVYRPLPYGDIADETNSPTQATHTRLLTTYKKNLLHNMHVLSIAGLDIYQTTTEYTTRTYYNYQSDGSYDSPDYNTSLPLFGQSYTAKIPYNYSYVKYKTNFFSYYTNHIITFSNRYSFSTSARRDATNLVGSRTNARGIPLWSVGGAWHIHQEHFFRLPAIKELKLRISYGNAGNVTNTVSSEASATYSDALNRFRNRIGRITSPPNENLRWEKVTTFNTGLDFNIQNNLHGSIDAYWKKADDLISEGNINATLGLASYVGNFGSMESKGVDVALHFTPILHKSFSWNTSVMLSWSVDKVTKNKYTKPTVNEYFSNIPLNALNNYPLYSIFSLPYQGLNETGNPISLFDGVPSTNYSAIASSTELTKLIYNGPSRPTKWGSVINNLHFKRLTLSTLFSFKAGYFYRRPTIQYSAVSKGLDAGHPDFDHRWKKAGDELQTIIPSFIYPIDAVRDFIYAYSNALVEKGDHIRWENIRVSYSFPKYTLSFLCNNIGIIWRANKSGIDPDYIPNGIQRITTPTKTFTFNITVNL